MYGGTSINYGHKPRCGERMAEERISRVGKRGELYPPKELREAAKIRPGSNVIFRVVGDKLEVESIPSLIDLLNMKPIAKITLKEFEDFRSKLSREMILT